MGKYQRINTPRHPPTVLTRLERAVHRAEQERDRQRIVARHLPPKEPDATFEEG